MLRTLLLSGAVVAATLVGTQARAVQARAVQALAVEVEAAAWQGAQDTRSGNPAFQVPRPVEPQPRELGPFFDSRMWAGNRGGDANPVSRGAPRPMLRSLGISPGGA